MTFNFVLAPSRRPTRKVPVCGVAERDWSVFADPFLRGGYSMARCCVGFRRVAFAFVCVRVCIPRGCQGFCVTVCVCVVAVLVCEPACVVVARIMTQSTGSVFVFF